MGVLGGVGERGDAEDGGRQHGRRRQGQTPACPSWPCIANPDKVARARRRLPLPAAPKQAALKGLERSALSRLRLCVPLGNLWLVAQKPGL